MLATLKLHSTPPFMYSSTFSLPLAILFCKIKICCNLVEKILVNTCYYVTHLNYLHKPLPFSCLVTGCTFTFTSSFITTNQVGCKKKKCFINRLTKREDLNLLNLNIYICISTTNCLHDTSISATINMSANCSIKRPLKLDSLRYNV